MEFGIRENTGAVKKILTRNFLEEKYPLDLTMYIDPPDEKVPIDEIRDMTIERLKLFRILEIASIRTEKGKTFKDIVIEEMMKENLKHFMPLIKGLSDVEARRKDHLSHYMLRLCYCRSEEYKKWFVARELEFFKLKFFNIDKNEDLALFFKKNQLSYAPISESEKLSISFQLLNSTSKIYNLETVNIYKVYFTEVLDLVKYRKVFISNGYAYVPQTELYSLLSSIYKKMLIEELKYFSENLENFENDKRVSAIIRGLHTCYTGKDYITQPTNKILKENLYILHSKSFPPCMKKMFDTLLKTHHLKHDGRQQLGLFLKGIGVSLEDSLMFWKENFTKNPDINSEVFEKKYAYNIRHNYGKEGKRANYTPHNCMKIINTNVGPGQNHGCPFKHYDQVFLRKMLLNFNISPINISTIIEYASKGHYQLACTKYFEVTHNVTNANGINHPNQYFEDSQRILKEKEMEVDIVQEKKNEKISAEFQEWDDDGSFDFDISTIVSNAESTK